MRYYLPFYYSSFLKKKCYKIIIQTPSLHPLNAEMGYIPVNLTLSVISIYIALLNDSGNLNFILVRTSSLSCSGMNSA